MSNTPDNTPKDILGNDIRTGDLVMYAEQDMMPAISVVDRVTETRCYFPAWCGNRIAGGEIHAFRAPAQLLSLTALGIAEEDCHGSVPDGSDFMGKKLVPGAKVVFIDALHHLALGTLSRSTAKMCWVRDEDDIDRRTRCGYVLQYE